LISEKLNSEKLDMPRTSAINKRGRRGYGIPTLAKQAPFLKKHRKRLVFWKGLLVEP
jgi:hypothetical protein